MRIDGLSERPKVQPSAPRSVALRAKEKGVGPGDVVEISQGAQDVADLSALATTAPVETNPRLQEIRDRVRSGHYDTPEVRQEIASAVLSSDSLRQVTNQIGQVQGARQQLSGVPDVRADRVAAARERVGNGHYDSIQARQGTADQMLSQMA